MISGNVVDLQAQVGIVFRLLDQRDIEIQFVVDTGFAGSLTLPPAAISALGLPFLQEMVANLADDTNTRVDVHVATIVLDGNEYEVAVLAMGTRPLLGTALLAGKERVVQFTQHGLVTIDDL